MSTSRFAPVAARTVSRRAPAVARRHLAQQATTAQSTGSKLDVSHAVVGVISGGVVLGGVYLYYQRSGAAKVVNTTKSVLDQAKSAKDQIADRAPSAKEAIGLIKSLTKSYLAAVPGAGVAIDSVFSKVEELAETHGQEVQEVLQNAYKELSEAIQDKKNGGEKIMKSLQQTAEKLQKLAGVEGGKVLDKLYEKAPELKDVVGKSSEQFNKLGDKYGPEAKKIVDDTYQRVTQIIQKGGLNAKTYEEVKKLIEEKTQQITELAKKSGSDAWEASSKAAAPLLDKMPDVQKLVEEKVGNLKGFVGEENVKVVQDFYAGLDKIQKSDKSAEEKAKAAKKYVEEQVGSLDELSAKVKASAGKAAQSWSSGASDQLSKAAAAIPGLGGLSQILNGEDLGKLKELAEKHGKDAEKVLNSAYDDIKKVLRKHVDEAKKVADNATEDAKKEVKK